MYIYIYVYAHTHLEKEMVTHSSILAWRIPDTVEPGGLQSMELHTTLIVLFPYLLSVVLVAMQIAHKLMKSKCKKARIIVTKKNKYFASLKCNKDESLKILGLPRWC